MAPFILNLGTRWRRAVSFPLRPLWSWRKNPGTDWIRGRVGPGNSLEILKNRKISCPSRDSNLELSIPYLFHYTDCAIRAPVVEMNGCSGTRIGYCNTARYQFSTFAVTLDHVCLPAVITSRLHLCILLNGSFHFFLALSNDRF
jgi:hypothetical protein